MPAICLPAYEAHLIPDLTGNGSPAGIRIKLDRRYMSSLEYVRSCRNFLGSVVQSRPPDGLLALSFLMLIIVIPYQLSPVRQRAQVYLWSAIILIIYSVLVSLFRMKNRGNHFLSTPRTLTESPHCRLSVQAVPIGKKITSHSNTYSFVVLGSCSAVRLKKCTHHRLCYGDDPDSYRKQDISKRRNNFFGDAKSMNRYLAVKRQHSDSECFFSLPAILDGLVVFRR
jgi:hypothetical protein